MTNKKVNSFFMLFFVALFNLCPLMTNAQNDLLDNGLKGRIKKVTVKEYYYTNEVEKYVKRLTSTYAVKEFTSGGNFKAQTLFYNEDSRIADNMSCIYDDYGRLIRREFKGKAIETFKYNVKGLKVSRRFEGIKWNTISTTHFSYNSQGSLLQEEEFEDEIMVEGYYYIYDNQGNMIEKKRKKWLDRVRKYMLTSSLFKYDKAGNTIEDKDTDGFHRIISSYDENGRKIEYAAFDDEDILIRKWSKKYNSKGDEIFYKYLSDFDGEIVINYQYKYDKHGNWIELNEEKDGNKNGFIERLIEYYD